MSTSGADSEVADGQNGGQGTFRADSMLEYRQNGGQRAWGRTEWWAVCFGMDRIVDSVLGDGQNGGQNDEQSTFGADRAPIASIKLSKNVVRVLRRRTAQSECGQIRENEEKV